MSKRLQYKILSKLDKKSSGNFLEELEIVYCRNESFGNKTFSLSSYSRISATDSRFIKCAMSFRIQDQRNKLIFLVPTQISKLSSLKWSKGIQLNAMERAVSNPGLLSVTAAQGILKPFCIRLLNQ